MKVNHFIEENILYVEFNEELDHHSTTNLRKRLDYEIERFMARKVIFDFKNVSFMDSAGIGFLIGRYKKTRKYGGQAELLNVNLKLKKIFEMSGILKIMSINQEENLVEKI